MSTHLLLGWLFLNCVLPSPTTHHNHHTCGLANTRAPGGSPPPPKHPTWFSGHLCLDSLPSISLYTAQLPARCATCAHHVTRGTHVAGVVGDSPLREGIVQGFLLIFFSEIGDKTFFIALLLAA